MSTSESPQNAAVWFEIPVTDLKRSKSFYEAVTRAPMTEDDTGPNPIVVFSVQDPKTGVSGHLYPGKPARDTGNTIHLAVPTPLEDTIERVGPAGGKVVSPIIAIPAGRFAYCQDPDGNSIGLFTPS